MSVLCILLIYDYFDYWLRIFMTSLARIFLFNWNSSCYFHLSVFCSFV